MSNHEFTLKSGATLQVTTAAFEIAVALVEAVKAAAFGMPADSDVTGDIILSSPAVRKALFPAFKAVWWKPGDKVLPVSAELFDDPEMGEKARGDYFEICSRVIEVNTQPFFLKTSSASRPSVKFPTENQESS